MAVVGAHKMLVQRVAALENELKELNKTDTGNSTAFRRSLETKIETLGLGIEALKSHIQSASEVQDRLDDFVTALKNFLEENEEFDEESFEEDFTIT